MRPSIILFISMFTTLLAIINPLEAIPVFLGLMGGKDSAEQNKVARKSCLYATLLAFFFLLFGTLMLRLFGVPLSMIRVVGGIILTRIGFQMFNPPPQAKAEPASATGQSATDEDVSFVPLAMPIMFGPGAIATIIGMASTVKQSREEVESFVAISLAIIATMAVTCLSLIYSKGILQKVGPKGIDAATRIVGFFVSAMGMGLIFHGMVESLQSYGVVGGKVASIFLL
jgi:multiple antibiotic resistance protein